MSDLEARLPVHLLIDAILKPLNGQGIFYYIHQRGESNTGTILLKLNNIMGECSLLVQQRDLEGKLGWVNAMSKEQVEEIEADEYIRRSISRDPDLWVIEIEDQKMNNPFDRV